jgi:hydrogenase/urease accessory protein HupE
MGEPVGLTHLRALIVALLLGAPASAHEIGTTRVRIIFYKNSTYKLVLIAKRPRVEACELRFDGANVTFRYKAAYATYALTMENEGSPPVHQWIEGDAWSRPFACRGARLARPAGEDARRYTYLLLGFTHIIPHGFDHILFVLGLFLLSTKLKPVLAQVTAFTIAHSITLGLTIYGVVSISPRIVEPMIALSIAYVAIENLMTTQLRPWRIAIVFGFGLLHGMGFAGVLKELGLPRSQFLTALITFNVGVEAGQLAVIGTAFLLVACWARMRPWYRSRIVVPASVLIAATGLFWTVARLSLASKP